MTRTDSASRVIHADPERVFAALVDPQALTEWLPLSGMTGRFARFNARPGGSYRLVLTYNDGSLGSGKATADSDIVEARFVEIVPKRAGRAGGGLRLRRPGICRHHDYDLGAVGGDRRNSSGDPSC
jgi:Activator of Hsp90 ATPase homolog 1-like protein